MNDASTIDPAALVEVEHHVGIWFCNLQASVQEATIRKSGYMNSGAETEVDLASMVSRSNRRRRRLVLEILQSCSAIPDTSHYNLFLSVKCYS